MSTVAKINDDLVTSIKSRTNELRVSTLRLMKAAIKNAEIAKRGRGSLNEEDIISVLYAMVKQRKDSAEQYEKAKRNDLADKENREIKIIQEYLPRQLSPQEVDTLIYSAIEKTGSSGIKEMGRLMKELMPLIKGKADGKEVNQRVKEILEKMGK